MRSHHNNGRCARGETPRPAHSRAGEATGERRCQIDAVFRWLNIQETFPVGARAGLRDGARGGGARGGEGDGVGGVAALNAAGAAVGAAPAAAAGAAAAVSVTGTTAPRPRTHQPPLAPGRGAASGRRSSGRGALRAAAGTVAAAGTLGGAAADDNRGGSSRGSGIHGSRRNVCPSPHSPLRRRLAHCVDRHGAAGGGGHAPERRPRPRPRVLPCRRHTGAGAHPTPPPPTVPTVARRRPPTRDRSPSTAASGSAPSHG